MFSGSKGLGENETGIDGEDYGPPTPTEAQKTGQAIVDVVKSDVPLTKTNFMYIAGGVIVAYVVWQYFFKDMLPDENY